MALSRTQPQSAARQIVDEYHSAKDAFSFPSG